MLEHENGSRSDQMPSIREIKLEIPILEKAWALNEEGCRETNKTLGDDNPNYQARRDSENFWRGANWALGHFKKLAGMGQPTQSERQREALRYALEKYTKKSD